MIVIVNNNYFYVESPINMLYILKKFSGNRYARKMSKTRLDKF